MGCLVGWMVACLVALVLSLGSLLDGVRTWWLGGLMGLSFVRSFLRWFQSLSFTIIYQI